MVDTQRSMTKMANRKTRGVVKYKSEIVTKKIEDASETVQHPPVFSEDSKYLCLISGSNIRVYSVESAEKIHTLGNHAADVIGVSIKDGRLVSCDTSGMVIEWDINNGKALETLKIGIPSSYQLLSFHNPESDKYFVKALSDKQGDLWIIGKKLKERKIISNINCCAHSIAFGCKSVDSLIVAALREDSVIVKDLRSNVDKKYI